MSKQKKPVYTVRRTAMGTVFGVAVLAEDGELNAFFSYRRPKDENSITISDGLMKRLYELEHNYDAEIRWDYASFGRWGT